MKTSPAPARQPLTNRLIRDRHSVRTRNYGRSHEQLRHRHPCRHQETGGCWFRDETGGSGDSSVLRRESRLATKDDLKIAISELKGDISELRAEFKSDIAKLEAGNAVLEERINSVHTDLQGQIVSVRTDLQEQTKSIRTEFRVTTALLFALIVPVFLRSFGLV